MKNFTFLIVLMFLVMGSMAQNVIVAGDFEGLENDNFGRWYRGGDVVIEKIPEDQTKTSWVINGEQSARLTGRTSARWLTQKVGVEAGQDYDFKCKIRICNWDGVNEKGGTAFIRIGTEDAVGDKTWTDIAQTQSADVIELTGEFSVPSGIDSVHVQITKDAELIWVDDVEFGKKGTLTSNKLFDVSNETHVFVSSNKMLNIRSNEPLMSYAVYNIAGQMINHNDHIGAPNLTVDLQGKPGIYLVKTVSSDRKSETHKVMVK